MRYLFTKRLHLHSSAWVDSPNDSTEGWQKPDTYGRLMEIARIKKMLYRRRKRIERIQEEVEQLRDKLKEWEEYNP